MCFLGVIWGKEGQENQKPASQICHRLWSRTQLSERGRHPEDRRVHRRRAAPGPFLYLGSPARPPSHERPPPSPLPASQGFAKGSPASRPSAVPPQPPSPLGETNPRGAAKGRSGRRWGQCPARCRAPVPCPLRRPNR